MENAAPEVPSQLESAVGAEYINREGDDTFWSRLYCFT